jgi:hypothetical protein
MNQTIPAYPPVVAETLVRDYHLTFNGSADVVFPLLCPSREYEWIPGWSCELVHSTSGVIEEGCIFRTQQMGMRVLWYVAIHDPVARTIVFVQHIDDDLVMRFTIRVEEAAPARTTAHIRQAFTAVSEKGAAFLRDFPDETRTKGVMRLETLMNYFLEHGRSMPE